MTEKATWRRGFGDGGGEREGAQAQATRHSWAAYQRLKSIGASGCGSGREISRSRTVKGRQALT